MRDGWRTVALGDVARFDVERVDVGSGRTYRIADVLKAGQGMLKRQPIDGADSKYPVLHRLRTGQLVYRKLTAWEGPMTVVPQELDGYFVSTEFFTFTLDQSLVMPEYMRLVCQHRDLWGQIRYRSMGTTPGRKRVSAAQLLQLRFPLPPLDAQRRIVVLVDAVDRCLNDALSLVAGASSVAQSMRVSHFLRKVTNLVKAGDFFEITIGKRHSPKHATGENMVPYLRSASIKDGYINLDDVKSMNFTAVEQQKYALRDGDVLITEGCASLEQLGAPAQWCGDGSPVCFDNTLLRLRARPGVSKPAYAYQWARFAFESDAFASAASGTNIFHIGATRAAGMLVPAIDIAAQDRFVAAAESADGAATAARCEANALETLRDCLLDELLSGIHMIPVPATESA